MKKFLFFVCFVLFFVSVFAVVPSVSSSSHPNQNSWYSNTSISLSWSLSGATECAFELNNEEVFEPDISLAENVFSIDYRNRKPDVYFFHVKCKTSSGWSNTAQYKIQIDRSTPPRPEEISAVALDDGSIKISWSEVIDPVSGISHYNVYRSNLAFVRKGDISFPWRVFDPIAVLVGEEIKDTFFIDKDVCGGCRRHYKVQAVDSAGNVGIESQSVSDIAVAFCDVSFDFDFVLNEDDFFEGFIQVNGIENEGRVAKPSVFLVFPDGSEEEIFSSSSYSIDLIEFEYDFSSKPQGKYFFRVEAEDFQRVFCTDEWIFFFDKVSPEITLISSLDFVLQETIELEVKVTDEAPSSGVDIVYFYLNDSGFKKIGESTEKNDVGNFVFSWDTLKSSNGRRELKIVAEDNAGNKAELIEIVSIDNVLDLLNDINALFESIELKKKEVLELRTIFELQGFEINSFDSFLVSADSNLMASKELFNKKINLDRAKNYAENSLNLLNSALNSVQLSEREPLRYVFNKSELESIFVSAGLNPEFISEAIQNIDDLGFSRSLNLLRIEEKENVFYLASIEIILFNGSNEVKEFILIEDVPKEFARNSSLITSEHELVFVKHNPVFYSNIFLPPQEKFSFVYYLNKSVSFEELVNLSNSINLFDSPSAIVSTDKRISGNVFNKPFDFDGFVLGIINLITLNESIPLWVSLLILGSIFVLGFGLIVLVLVVTGIYFLFFKKKAKQKTLKEVYK